MISMHRTANLSQISSISSLITTSGAKERTMKVLMNSSRSTPSLQKYSVENKTSTICSVMSRSLNSLTLSRTKKSGNLSTRKKCITNGLTWWIYLKKRKKIIRTNYMIKCSSTRRWNRTSKSFLTRNTRILRMKSSNFTTNSKRNRSAMTI